MKKIQKILYLLACFLLAPTACSKAPATEQAILEAIAPKGELSIASSQEGVSDFLAKNESFAIENDACYNITPDFISEHSDFSIFKFDKSTDSFLLYDGETYSIGTCFGGYGITSMALADLNQDDQYELYYTFSWGSGIPRSQVGYFDPASREITVFEDSFYFCNTMLTVDNSGQLCVNLADLNLDSFVDFSVSPQEAVGTIVREGERITLKADEAMSKNEMAP